MATFGELTPGMKLRKVSEEDAGKGERADPGGPLDLEAGVVFLRPRAAGPAESAETPDESPE
ncbi:hypothetical protein UO65_1364 [Actinokineospora spheciospongiae]|uniref:Uncharacterized protein n=1 Tax=Actinokineospora spheciospongiae TaxID=909613 RepID=W7J345_9PSEU|nr:hypothetical protein [Actinokineospora spheciospongiae]EWC63366.1 hypothetical protein UO65_1364 [Actinokineospora spheciospongiae]